MWAVPMDYETLRLVWWLLLGILLIGFAVMDGFDLGVGALLPMVARNDTERRMAINAIGPVWEGNQVWLVLGAGAIFAAWPLLYAAAFSGFYAAMFVVLMALILRPVGFDFRNKVKAPAWRAVWDTALFLGGLVPAVVFGVALGNLLQGVPFWIDADLRIHYEGDFLGLLNPFGVLAGLLSLSMLSMHGGTYLALKTADPVNARARRAATVSACATFILFAGAGLWVAFGMDGFTIVSEIDAAGPSNPLLKEVVQENGAWLASYAARPWTVAAPVLGFLGAIGVLALTRARREGLAFVASALAVTGIVATAGLSMFPFLMPSNLDPRSSLTVWDASSSHMTLFVMLLATAVFMPLVIVYTAFVYRVLRGKVTAEYVERNSTNLY